MDYYSNNKASTYQIRMPRTFYLRGKYEVALAEIQYPHTWTTMRDGLDYIIYYRRANGVVKELQVPIGYYRSMDKLITTINELLEDQTKIDENVASLKPIWLKYDVVTRHVYPILKQDFEISFSTGIAEVFGFIPGKWYQKRSVSEHKADVRHGFYTLFVYCSLCEPQVVGDYYVPLLRSVSIQGHDGDVVMKTYGEPHYVPVNTSKFDMIEINIKDDTGRNVSFQSGKVVCKLHFRQKAL